MRVVSSDWLSGLVPGNSGGREPNGKKDLGHS